MDDIVIVDFGMGNCWSVQNALNFLGLKSKISQDNEKIINSKCLILPGVGSFKKAMLRIKEMKIDIAMNETIKKNSKILGICLGMQLLGNYSEEDGGYEGLNLIDNKVDIITKNNKIKIPHVGFNSVKIPADSLLFNNIDNESDFYFNHSYCMFEKLALKSASTCVYGKTFVASFEAKNIYGTQFHPEKSQTNGLLLLKNFFSLMYKC